MDTYDMMVQLAACLQVELENDEAPVCWVGTAPGDGVVADNAGCGGGKCGQAWVRLGTGYPSTRTGVQDSTVANCAKPLGVDLEIGVLRCFDVNQNTGGPKDPAAVTKRQVADMHAMRRAVTCCDMTNTDYILGSYRPAPVQGGVTGGFWLLHLGTML